ncbi:uncharacterized protein LOC6544782 [Drosophila erecta]|uniref:Uncharacterized protein n=1 Tax=Drosophila erecta TaxID=7220 RepID=B3NBN2_DROER|nr:uncharacterized protein LOC6544782 [Drosophila erecta]EDV50628.1 uncharacterized protein Dere_GG15057 [Drosophila erecta]
MQQSQILKNLCLIVVLSSVAVMVQGVCNSCQTSNNVKCLNETHYSLCSDNVAPNQVLQCPDNKVCTDLAIICMDSGVVEPSCSATADGSCPTCDGNSIFVCTSRTTFQMCDGSNLTGQVAKCKDNKICSINSGKYCVDLCEVGDSVECDRENPL